ncbi:hypothetical protein G6011_07838 [Alternaria panax]|uniref:Uncharacterized protein n=1 Tax=Alternaria panax TaxID=48097 RepID=A0AAD4I793_9PLEO|nr:hypothetical protein G6011_07838 [Alternaria panax]
MAKRKCPRTTQQDGVCGCPSFWKRSKAIPIRKNKGVSTSAVGSSSLITVIHSEPEENGDLHQRKRQKRENSVVPNVGRMSPLSSKSAGYMESKLVVGKYARQKQNIAKGNTRAHENESVRKEQKAKAKAKTNTPVRILVDYDLPTGAERLDWDTDEVRRRVGEIA